MDIVRYLASLEQDAPPAGLEVLLLALWQDARGNWERAHRIVQSEEGKLAARIHAYLHRKEGDLANADYWYRRSGEARSSDSLDTEWRGLVDRVFVAHDRGNG